MSKFSIQTILEAGERASSRFGRYTYDIKGFGRVVTEDEAVVTVISYGRASQPEFQGWVVEILLTMLVM